jgi:ATP-dependent Lon protease
LPEEAQKRIDEEMEKISVLEVGSPEYGVTRNYLDWLTQLPWGKYSKDKLDLKHARKILDRDHDGLADVKDRIIEFLAVGAMKGESRAPSCCSSGPVAKTSISRSIATALGRKFCSSRSVACATRPRSRVTAGLISVPCRASSCRRSRTWAWPIR